MYTFKKILVPTDLSDNASAAYPLAQEIAARYDATVDFIHIIPMLHYFHESMDTLNIPLNMEKDVYPKIQKRTADKINELMSSFLQPQNKGKGVVTIARKPAIEIADFAEGNGYDLIVMATNGQHESDLLRGSITEKVIRYAHTPVLTTQIADPERFKTLLLPTDGSMTSLEALPIAVSMALIFNASITLYHVLELHGSMTESAPRDPHKTVEENIHNTLYRALEEFLESQPNSNTELRRGDNNENQLVYTEGASSATINVKTVIEKGVSAHHAITSYAGSHADMVIMATHGRSGLAHLLLGSTAEKVAQHLDLPVLTVKPDLHTVT